MKEASLEQMLEIGIPQNVVEELMEKLKEKPNREIYEKWCVAKVLMRILPRILSPFHYRIESFLSHFTVKRIFPFLFRGCSKVSAITCLCISICSAKNPASI